MDDQINSPETTNAELEEQSQKLINAFFQFHKLKWWSPNRSLGFKRSEMRLIFMLRDLELHLKRKVSVSDISNYLRVTSPSVTHLLNSLEEKGIVERTQDENDRRSVRVKLTESGLEIINSADKKLKRNFNGLIEELGLEQSAQLYTLLSEAIKYFNKVTLIESMKKDECVLNLKKLLKHAGKYKAQLLALVITVFLQVTAQLYLPNLMSDIVNNGIAKGNIPYIWSIRWHNDHYCSCIYLLSLY